jgi:hypothetical protein
MASDGSRTGRWELLFCTALAIVGIRESIRVDNNGSHSNKLVQQLIEAPSTCGKLPQKYLLHFQNTSECSETGIYISSYPVHQLHRAVARVCVVAAHEIVVTHSWANSSMLLNHVPKVELVWFDRHYSVGPMATWPKAVRKRGRTPQNGLIKEEDERR